MVKNTKKNESSTGGYLTLVIPIAFGVAAILAAGRIFVPLALVTGIGWALKRYWLLQQNKLAQLNAVFYRLIQENQGRITTLDLAMKANVSGAEAQNYLDGRSKEFSAHFEVTDQGGMLYFFETAFPSVAGESHTLVERKPPVSTVPAQPKIYSSSPTQSFIAQSQNRLSLPAPMTQAELARRFNVHANTVSKWKSKPEFSDWSRGKDPAGIAWKYEPEQKRFCPLS